MDASEPGRERGRILLIEDDPDVGWYMSRVLRSPGGFDVTHELGSVSALHRIETEMLAGNPASRSDRIPVDRFGTPEEVASILVAVASNPYITGKTASANPKPRWELNACPMVVTPALTT